MTTLAAIYCRISTDEDLQKFSLAGQEEELRRYASSRGWDVYKLYHDQASGSALNRPGLQAMLDDMADGKFTTILVVDQDRLSRLDPIEWELVKRQIRDAGVKVVTPFSMIDFGDEDSELISDVFNLFARHQRRKLRKAMVRGQEERARRGQWTGGVPDGYIYDRSTGKLRPDPVRRQVVERIFNEYASGRGLHKIASALNRDGIRTAEGRRWNDAGVMRVLKSRTYLGELRFRRIQLTGVHEPIIAPETWAKAQSVYAAHREEYRFDRKHVHLLAGRLRCGRCGRLLQVKTNRKLMGAKAYRYHYYQHRAPDDREQCKVSHRVDEIDQKVISALVALGSSPEAARRLICARNTQSERKRLQAEVSRATAALAKIQASMKRLMELYVDESWDRAMLDEKKTRLEAQMSLARDKLEEVRSQLEMARAEVFDIKAIVNYFAALRNIETEMSREDLKALICSIFSEIRVSERGELVLLARIPLDGFFGSNPSRGVLQCKGLDRKPARFLSFEIHVA